MLEKANRGFNQFEAAQLEVRRAQVKQLARIADMLEVMGGASSRARVSAAPEIAPPEPAPKLTKATLVADLEFPDKYRNTIVTRMNELGLGKLSDLCKLTLEAVLKRSRSRKPLRCNFGWGRGYALRKALAGVGRVFKDRIRPDTIEEMIERKGGTQQALRRIWKKLTRTEQAIVIGEWMAIKSAYNQTTPPFLRKKLEKLGSGRRKGKKPKPAKKAKKKGDRRVQTTLWNPHGEAADA